MSELNRPERSVVGWYLLSGNDDLFLLRNDGSLSLVYHYLFPCPHCHQVIKGGTTQDAKLYLRRGAPVSSRPAVWSKALGLDGSRRRQESLFLRLKKEVERYDLLVDRLHYVDAKYICDHDDNYFVFEDPLLEVLMAFSRDTEVLDMFPWPR